MIVVGGQKHSCTNEMCTIAALLSVPPIFVRPRDKAKESKEAKMQFNHLSQPQINTQPPPSQDGDHQTFMNAFNAYITSAGSSDQEKKSWCQYNFLSFRALASAENVRKQLVQLW